MPSEKLHLVHSFERMGGCNSPVRHQDAPQPLQRNPVHNSARTRSAKRHVRRSSYFKPTFLWPATLAYQSETGLSQA